MYISGIIAEYNPLHNGHLRQLQEVRRDCDGIVVAMSGDFVQRGEPALVDKHRRARMALEAGADLVLELPPAAACGGAESFARGGVGVLAATGLVDRLCCGAEDPDAERVTRLARMTEEESSPLSEDIRKALKAGQSYPKAMAAALEAIAPELADFISRPNDLLAVEYRRALDRLGSSMELKLLPRLGREHTDTELSQEAGDYASASAIRKALMESGLVLTDALLRQLPVTSAVELSYALFPDDVSAALRSVLLREDSCSLCGYADMTEELARRITAQYPYLYGFEELADRVTTRAYSRARVRRSLLHALLGLPQTAAPEPRALKLLGLRKDSPLPELLQKRAGLPVITKTARAERELALEYEAPSALYAQLVYQKTGLRLRTDLTQSPVVL